MNEQLLDKVNWVETTPEDFMDFLAYLGAREKWIENGRKLNKIFPVMLDKHIRATCARLVSINFNWNGIDDDDKQFIYQLSQKLKAPNNIDNYRKERGN